jgi:Common central domain of tyrosinase
MFWHRLFVREHEKKLQKINPAFFFPYWDSATDHGQVQTSPHWKYTGTSGIPVRDGIFANHTLSASEVLTRNFTWPALNAALPAREMFAAFYYKSLRNGYKDWWPDFNLYHGLMHNTIAGQMVTPRSPVDPLFFMHHAKCDYDWHLAQSGWKLRGMDINSQFDAAKNCTPTTKFDAYNNVLADVLDSETNMCVRYVPRKSGAAALLQPVTGVVGSGPLGPIPGQASQAPKPTQAPAVQKGPPKPNTNFQKAQPKLAGQPLGNGQTAQQQMQQQWNAAHQQQHHQMTSPKLAARSYTATGADWTNKDADSALSSFPSLETFNITLYTNISDPSSPYATWKSWSDSENMTSTGPSPDNYYHPGYIPMSNCPPRLPDSFKMMMGGLELMNKMEEHARSVCEETLKVLKVGGRIKLIPHVSVRIADGDGGSHVDSVPIVRVTANNAGVVGVSDSAGSGGLDGNAASSGAGTTVAASSALSAGAISGIAIMAGLLL